MKKSLIFSLLVLGMTSLVAQVIILRELMVSFYGNEFFLGLVLAAWLAGTALASLWLGPYLRRFIQSFKLLLFCHLGVALFLPILVCLVRLSRSWTAVAGQMPDLCPALAWAILLPAPLCLILGCQFVAAAESLGWSRPADRAVSRAYFLESLGFIMAGLIFSFFLILFNVWLSIFILVFLNGLAIYFLGAKLLTKLGALLLIFLAAFLSWPIFSQPLNQATLEWQFPHQQLIKTINSYYGQLAVTKIDQQYNFYQSGLWLGSSQPTDFNESLVHFSLLEHPQPKNILLFGHGLAGLLNEILKHQPAKITYLELDNQLIKLAKPYLLADWQKALANPRVKIVPADGRYYIKSSQEKFDLIMVNLADPSTALLNRFYTQEFFQETKSRLQPSGILAIWVSFSPNYQNQSLIQLNASIYQTLKKIFPHLILLPEEATLLFLASSEDILISQPEPLIQRWQQRNLETEFISPAYLEYVLTGERAKLAVQSLASQKIKINQDTWPISYLYNLFFWTSYFHPNLAKYLSWVLKINFWWIFGLFLLVLFILLFGRPSQLLPLAKLGRGVKSYCFSTRLGLAKPRSKNKKCYGSSEAPKVPSREPVSSQAVGRVEKFRSKSLWLAMAVAGFSLMASEILLIFAFQSFYGYLYARLALLITAFMIGLALGTWLGTQKLKTNSPTVRTLGLLHFLIVIYSLLIYLLFSSNLLGQLNWFLGQNFLFPLLAIIIGWLVGLEFVYVNHLYGLEQQKKPFHPGFIYSADLFGACLGAFLTSLFLIPLFGIFQTLIILVLLNGLIIILLIPRAALLREGCPCSFFAKNLGGEDI